VKKGNGGDISAFIRSGSRAIYRASNAQLAAAEEATENVPTLTLPFANAT
jgi:hypothetical protein